MTNNEFILIIILTIITVVLSFIIFKLSDKGSEQRGNALFIFLTSFIPFIALGYVVLFGLAIILVILDWIYSWLLDNL